MLFFSLYFTWLIFMILNNYISIIRFTCSARTLKICLFPKMFISRNDDSYHLSHIGNNTHQHFKKISRTICGFNYWAICSFLSEGDENTRTLLLVWGFCQTWKHTAHYYIVRDTFKTMQQRFWFHPPNYKWLKNDYYSPIWHLPSPRHPPPLPSP